MKPATEAAIIEHAQAEFPRECCGLIIVKKGREVYAPCRNEGVGSDNFVMPAEDYAAAEAKGEIVAVVHSHCNLPPIPSQADRVACEASGVPWHIIAVPTLKWGYLEPNGYKAPLVGREWAHGVLDCYAIIKDWYAEEARIELPEPVRHDHWWQKGENLYLDNYVAAGFSVISAEELKTGDVILMRIGETPVPNHGAVYLGDGIILHHIQGRLSSRDVYGGYWAKHTTHVLRHKDLVIS